MHLVNNIPILIFHFLERYIPQNSSIVYQNIHSLEVVHCCFYYLIAKLDRIVVCNCLSPLSFYLGHYLVS